MTTKSFEDHLEDLYQYYHGDYRPTITVDMVLNGLVTNTNTLEIHQAIDLIDACISDIDQQIKQFGSDNILVTSRINDFKNFLDTFEKIEFKFYGLELLNQIN